MAGDDNTPSPGQLGQFERQQGWLPENGAAQQATAEQTQPQPELQQQPQSQSTTESIQQQQTSQEPKPGSMAWLAKKFSFNTGNQGKPDNELTGDSNPATRKLTPLDPILHPLDTYETIAERRRYYQNFYPGEKYSDPRHATMSYWLTKEIGPIWTDLLGIGNEVQGFLRWDLPDLPARIKNERPWAFQLGDIDMNRRGIGSAVTDMLYPDAKGGPLALVPSKPDPK